MHQINQDKVYLGVKFLQIKLLVRNIEWKNNNNFDNSLTIIFDTFYLWIYYKGLTE